MAPSLEVESPLNGTFTKTNLNFDRASNGNAASINGHVQPPNSPVPEPSDLDFKSYDSQEALLADIIESIRTSGGCVIRNLIAKDKVAEIEKEVRPWLDKAEPWKGKPIRSA